ncbi:MAG: hypothetical protein QOF57_1985, partial [Frankiaceae bacterium]|nr:hypothetical protein [Frankiaceae bacterium]
MDEQGPDGSLPDAAGGNGPPRQVRIVAYLMLVNAAVALLSLVATLVTPIADYQATVTRLDPTLTADQANALANDIFRYHLAVAAVLLVANVGLSLGVRRGFSWARMASLLLTGMSLIVTVSGGTGGGAVAG